jgi:HK97 family phage major capsid protein
MPPEKERPMTERLAFRADVTAEGRRIRGFVKLAGERTRRGNEWLEIDPAALVKADASGVVGRWEHDPHKILGRPSNGTLKLSRTDQGIEYELSNLPQTAYANDALELVRGGYVTGSSFEIEGPLRYSFSVDPVTGDRIRRITHIARLTDVSPVSDPAFSASSAQAFSKEYDSIMEPTTIVEPQAPVAPAPVITDDKSDFYRRAEAFARDKSLGDLEAFMDNLVSEGLDSDAKRDQYDAFASVYDDRKRTDTDAKDRLERIALAHKMRLGIVPKSPASNELHESADYLQAFNRFLRGDGTAMEQFGQSIAGDGTQGGYTVPDGFLNRMTETLKAYGGIASVADTITTSDGQSLRWPSNDDTANAAAIATEGAAVGSGGADKVFGSVTLGAYTYDATGTGNLPLLVSKELLQDAAFDIEGFVSRNLSQRIGRKQAANFATGTGAAMPLGLFAKVADVMTATSMYAALVEQMFQVDQAYRESGNCRWVLGDTVLSKVYNSVDKSGRPLFIPSADSSGAGNPAGMLLGFPVQLDQGSAGLVAFGDIRAGYIIRYVRGVQVDVDPYSNIKSRQVAYHAWARADANVQDSAAYSVSDYAGVSANAV